MSRTLERLVFAGVSFGFLIAGLSAQTYQLGTKDGEWPAYAGDLSNYRYSPLDQINASNFGKLEVAWRFKTDSLGTRPEYKLEGTPIMVKGVMYATAGTRRSVVALDAATGELLWVHGEHEGARGAAAARQLSGRGLSYWSDGKGDDRILYVTPGYRLVALDAKTGAPIKTFGSSGMVDMKTFAVYGTGQPIDLTNGEIGLHSTPAVTKSGIVLVGSSFREGNAPKTHNNTKGLVLAFDVRTGKKLWQFNTIPRPGEFGNDTWLRESWATNGNTGVWTQIAVDEQLGLAYLPVETPTSDYYGGQRPGNNLFAETLVCVDLKTGKRKWHFQLSHHPIWDYDISSAPMLADLNVDGKTVKAVIQPTKQCWLFVFDRVTGQPVWPIEERPVPQGDVPGEWYSPTQPFPTKPPAYARQGVSIDELIDFTPEMRAEAVKIASQYRLGPMYTPPALSKPGGPFATLVLPSPAGGTNWPGAAYDPETHIAYAYAQDTITPLGLVPTPDKEFSDMDYIMGRAGMNAARTRGRAPSEGSGADIAPPPVSQAPPAAGRGGGGGGGFSVQGLPLLKPPYGHISAINMDKGEIVWQVANGETPDFIRNHPALKGLNIPNTGQPGYDTGTLVTKTLVIQGDTMLTTSASHPRGAMLRAYDKATGKQLGAVWMPAPQTGSPMTYSVNGKQYLVVAISGANYSGEYLAFALPE
ncbi:MAG TPA: pyrroloquinoline quinone-dependent dehydrogenase [Bryobacteraceae bacterium]|nr:pyrroloquinoline quinone-dependent dehydrogenase [Bryobacteraceae bacterium]